MLENIYEVKLLQPITVCVDSHDIFT